MALTDSTDEGTVPTDTLAVRLAIVRAQLGGLNIKRAAEKCGVSPESWRLYESGRLPRDLHDLCSRIARATGVSYEWLMIGGPLARNKCVTPFALLNGPDGQMELGLVDRPDLFPVG